MKFLLAAVLCRTCESPRAFKDEWRCAGFPGRLSISHGCACLGAVGLTHVDRETRRCRRLRKRSPPRPRFCRLHMFGVFPPFGVSFCYCNTIDHLNKCIHLLLFSRSVMSDSLWPHGLRHARLPWPSLSPRVCVSAYWVAVAIQPFQPLSPSSPPALSIPQHQENTSIYVICTFYVSVFVYLRVYIIYIYIYRYTYIPMYMGVLVYIYVCVCLLSISGIPLFLWSVLYINVCMYKNRGMYRYTYPEYLYIFLYVWDTSTYVVCTICCCSGTQRPHGLQHG